MAAAARYPISRFALALFLGALPYYFALAWLGSRLKVPGWILFTAAIALVLLGLLIDRLRQRRRPA